ncbi:MAG TPA: ArsA family ATPase [Solirubrobacteraceae bacterium]|jgi:anion-transporting  ArsA/GET3 family ATPase|nr:ArsA family ATPase [Solirubrobacteraceae bacterium]
MRTSAPTPLLDRSVLLVTGKGGVGKTTIAAALGLLAVERGHRTMLVELGDQHRVPRLFGVADPELGEEAQLADGLWTTSIDPYQTLIEWMDTQIAGRVPARVLGGSQTFHYFVAAAPGAKEVLAMTKVWDLAQAERWQRKARRYELVIVDAPATGHALGMLRAPRTVAGVARVGPVAHQAQRVRDFLEDPEHSGVMAVAQPTEMAVTETLDLGRRLDDEIGQALEAIVVNGVVPQRFSDEELDLLDVAARADGTLTAAAARAARAIHRRAAAQEGQIERLSEASARTITVPFAFVPELGLDEVRAIASRLGELL